MKKMTKNEIAATAKLIEQSMALEDTKALMVQAGKAFYEFVFSPDIFHRAEDDKERTEALESKLRGMLLEDEGLRFIDRVLNKGKFSGSEKFWLRFAEAVTEDFKGSAGEMFNVFSLFYKMASDVNSFFEKYGPMMG